MESTMRAQMLRQRHSTRSRTWSIDPTTGVPTKNPTADSGSGQATDKVTLGQNNTPDFAQMRELKKQRQQDLMARAKELMMDGKEPSATPSPETPVQQPTPEPKSWVQRLGDRLDNFREGSRAVARSSDHDTHVGYGVTGRSEKGSDTIHWSDGSVTFSPIHAWEKQVYGSN